MIKDFFKSLTIYGIIPIATKSAALLVVPIYTRILSPEQYGISELYLTFAMFINFVISMEIYSGVGRYYNEKKNTNELKELVSSGLLFTLVIGIVITLICFTFKDTFYKIIIPQEVGFKYYNEFLIILSLPLLLSVYDYLSVMMRYAGKPKIYLRISLIQLFVKITTTLVLLLVFNLGLSSIFYGMIAGTLSTIILLLYQTKENLSFTINKKYLRDILQFSLPIYPGLLILGFSRPLIRWVIGFELSLESLGLFSIAFQIVSVFAILQTGFRMTYRPFLFENMSNPNYISKLESILKIFLIPIILVLIPLIIFPLEALNIIASNKYLDAFSIVGILAIGSALDIITEFISFGPDIIKQTKFHTYNGIIRVISLVVSLYIFIHFFGFIGIGLGYFVGSVINFIAKYLTTNRLLKINFNIKVIFYVFIPLFFINLLMINYYDIVLFYKLIVFGIINILLYLFIRYFVEYSFLKFNIKNILNIVKRS